MGAVKKSQDEAYQISQKTLEHFNAIPWCRPTLSDADFHPVSMSRTVTDRGKGHTLMAKTWNTDATIRELLSFYRAPSPGRRAQVRRFYTFGDGLNAHPSLLHGGVIATILDSTMGNIIGQELSPRGPTYTVQLNTAYKSPVSTPGTIMAESWVRSVEDGGRKIWVEGVVRSEMDGKEVIHAKAEGLWIVSKTKL